MKHCCATCANQYIIERLDYTEGGCQHRYENGFACGAVLDEGIMYHRMLEIAKCGVIETILSVRR